MILAYKHGNFYHLRDRWDKNPPTTFYRRDEIKAQRGRWNAEKHHWEVPITADLSAIPAVKMIWVRIADFCCEKGYILLVEEDESIAMETRKKCGWCDCHATAQITQVFGEDEPTPENRANIYPCGDTNEADSAGAGLVGNEGMDAPKGNGK